MLTAKMKWAGGLKFEGISAFGHPIATDGGKAHGGKEEGYKPTELLLYGIAGCSGIDVVKILEKQGEKLESLEIELIAHQGDKFPKPFHTVEVKYIATGKHLDPKKVGLAIAMSESTYCAVSQTVENAGKIITSFEIREE